MDIDGIYLGWADRFRPILSFRWFTKHNASIEKQTPLEIAKERYAKGEITKEQYEQIKKICVTIFSSFSFPSLTYQGTLASKYKRQSFAENDYEPLYPPRHHSSG